MKGKFFIVACLALIAGLIVFHCHQTRSASSPPAPVPLVKKIVVQAQPAVEIAVTNQAQPTPAPETAATSASTNVVSDVNSPLTGQALMAWLRDLAATNYIAALEYVSKMSPGEEQDDASQAVCYGLARTDPARAVDIAQQLQEPAAVTENLVQQWAGSDMIAALVWVNNQPAGDARDEMIHRVVLLLASSDPSDAAGLVLEQIPAGQNQDEAVMTVINQWANKDLAAAAKWVETFPDGPLKGRAVAELEGVEKYQHDLAQSNN